jgi:O-antigen ligase
MSGKRRMARGEKEVLSSSTTPLSPLVVFVVTAMEVVLLVLVCLSPWAYGVVHPPFEFLLDAGIGVLLVLWAARMLLERQIAWKKSGVALCLASLFLYGVLQRTPLPRSMLAWVAPGTERCYAELLPKAPEVLRPSSGEETPAPPANPRAGPAPGSTVSLYPDATRRESLRILAVFLVFAVVHNNLTSPRILFRLSVVALINGVVLSLFALAQFFAAPRGTIYWVYPTLGQAFGPFINRNHFADYVNLCIGLGVGLLVTQNWRRRSSAFLEEESSLLQTLQNPHALWICAALGLMVSAVAFSRSRGGLLALVGAAVICGILGRLQLGRSFRIGSLLLVAGVVVSLSAWFGIGLLKDRLATLSSGEALEDRVPIWLRSLRIAEDFPIWGTGYGTFGYIEPMYHEDAPTREKLGWYGHAHNDYLEILVEGGIVGLALVLAALALVYRRGYHALERYRGRAEAGLALGALFAFTALALHSFGEFGTHIPAIMLLAIVICAHVCALGGRPKHRKKRSESEKKRSESEEDSDEYSIRLGGVAPVGGAIAALGFAVVLCSSGWKAHRIYRLEDAALRTSNTDAAEVRLRIAYLAAASSIDPNDARVHDELAEAHAQLAGLLTDLGDLAKQRMLALQEFLRARDACPLLGRAQLGIAAGASLLKQGDSAQEYIRRAKVLTPGQAEMCYRRGLQESMLNHYEEAWATWRHCLELSEDYLPQILFRTRRLRAEQLMEKVLPDNPDLLLVTALLRYPDPEAVKARSPFMDKALAILESKPPGSVPRDLMASERTFKARVEFARYLYYELGKVEEARRELRLVLRQIPNYGPALELLNEISRRRR